MIIVPGYADSGPEHWQSHWHALYPDAVRIVQKNWTKVDADAWVAVLDDAIEKSPKPVVLVGHSLGCSTILLWASRHKSTHKVKGALLVAPPDPDSIVFQELGLKGFETVPLNKLPFPSILIASEDDPFLSIEQAKHYAHSWGSQFVNVGKKGHLGNDSGVGDWEEGRKWLKRLHP